MTIDELLALENEYEPYILIWQFEYGVEEKIEQEGKDALTEEEMIVLAVQALDREVNNGGYHQFFTNSSVEYAPIIVGALHRIGCTRVAELTQEAIDILEIDGPLTVEAIEQAIHGEKSIESIGGKLEPLENEIYYSNGDCSYELIAFIKENRDRITVGE